MQLPKKHSATGTTIFTVMSSLAAECGAINLSQGFPDFPVDERLGILLHAATVNGFDQYAPMAGLPMLRYQVAESFRNRYGIEVDAEQEITVTPGATYGIYTALSSILSAGDEAIVFEPAYDSYIPNIEMNGARAVPVALSAPSFRVDWNKVKDAITDKTRAIVINTPHNPTGTIWSKEDLDELAALVRDRNICIVSDEVYEQLVYDGQKHFSVLAHPELRARSFAIFSFGKVYHNTGWKLGYCIAPPELSTAFRRLHQYLSFSVNTPAQFALAEYLKLSDMPPVHHMLEAKRNYFLEVMKGTPFTFLSPSAGSYFQLAGYEKVSDMPELEFAKWLTREYGVATIPVSSFYSTNEENKLLRFCFAKKEETLRLAAERLGKLSAVPAL